MGAKLNISVEMILEAAAKIAATRDHPTIERLAGELGCSFGTAKTQRVKVINLGLWPYDVKYRSGSVHVKGKRVAYDPSRIVKDAEPDARERELEIRSTPKPSDQSTPQEWSMQAIADYQRAWKRVRRIPRAC